MYCMGKCTIFFTDNVKSKMNEILLFCKFEIVYKWIYSVVQ